MTPRDPLPAPQRETRGWLVVCAEHGDDCMSVGFFSSREEAEDYRQHPLNLAGWHNRGVVVQAQSARIAPAALAPRADAGAPECICISGREDRGPFHSSGCPRYQSRAAVGQPAPAAPLDDVEEVTRYLCVIRHTGAPDTPDVPCEAFDRIRATLAAQSAKLHEYEFAAERVVDYFPMWFADRENDAAEFYLRAGVEGLRRALAASAPPTDTGA